MKRTLRIFNSLIVSIILYGSAWEPYMNFTNETRDNYNIERVHTKFLKKVLGCVFQTSNNISPSLKVYKPEMQHCVTMS